MNRYLVWLMGPVAGDPFGWYELPVFVAAEDENAAIVSAVGGATDQGRQVRRVTATLMPTEAATPPIGELGGLDV